jgi:hypothetical protein
MSQSRQSGNDAPPPGRDPGPRIALWFVAVAVIVIVAALIWYSR